MTEADLRRRWAAMPPRTLVVAKDEFEERAAIIEYDAGLPRRAAELQAAELVLMRHAPHDPRPMAQTSLWGPR